MNKKSCLFVIPMVAGALAGCGIDAPTDNHTLVLVPGQAATCTENGVLEHYHCDHCNKDFVDQYAEEEMSTTVVEKLGHDLTKHDAQNATCENTGTKAYWTCSREEGVYFKDAQGNEKFNSWEEIVVGKQDHNYTSLEISGDYKKDYVAFQEFDTTNLVVKAKCENCNNTITLDGDDYEISYVTFGADSLRAGETKVIIYASNLELSKEITGLTVAKYSVPKPNVEGSSFAYDGTEKTLDIPENTSKYSISNNKATKAGEYNATVSLLDKDNNQWADGTTDDLTFSFSIGKADNQFTGLGDSYTTVCGVEPDLTNVIATSGDISVKYYSDEGCETEVDSEDLIAGSYFMKVTAGGENYTEISKVVPLTVNHDVKHHEAVAAKILDKGNIEYWGCDGCGLAYADEGKTQQIDDVTIPATGVAISECAMDSNDIVFEADTQEEAPKGFEKVNKISLPSEDDTNTDFHEKRWDTKYFSQAVVDEYEAVAFAIKSADTTLYVDGYGHQVEDNSWVIVEITPLGDYNYNVLFRTEDGEEITTLSFKWGPESHPGAGYVDGAINAIMFKADCYPIEPTDNFLVTELKAVYKTEPVGELIENCAINSNGAAPVEKLMPAPMGFRHVSAVEVAGERGDTLYYSTVNVSQYNYLTFAIKTKSQYLLADGWAAYQSANVWVTVKIQNLGNHNYKVTFTNLSSPAATYVEEFEWAEATFGVADALNAIMFKANTYADGADTMYVTELRGAELEVVPTGLVINDCVMSGNSAPMSNSEVEAPKGYTSVKEGSFNDSVHGMYFSSTDLTAYEEVHFALKTDATYNFNNKNTYDGHGWMFFTLTNNGNETFDIVVVDENGNTIHQDTNLSGHRDDTTVYSNNALNAILYGNVGGYNPYTTGALTLYATELRGTKAPVVPTGIIVDSCAVSANGVSMATAEIELPDGFENVKVGEFTNNMHGQFYSAADLRKYSEVHFAMKTSAWVSFDDWNDGYSGDDWIVFSLTNNGDTTFNLTISKLSGEVLCTKENLASFKGDDPGVYANYALSAILFGNPGVGYAPNKNGETFNVYVTELRGTKIVVTPTGVVVDSCAVSANEVVMSNSEMEAPEGYESVKEGQFTDNMHGKVFSAANLSKYEEVHFALKTDGDFNFDNSSTYSGHGWIFFTLTNNGNETFNLVAVDENGTKLFEASNLSAHRDDTSVYGNDALNAILYGNPGRGYSPCGSGTINVYVTELRGTKTVVAPTGTIINNSAISGNGAVNTQIEAEPAEGFEIVNEIGSETIGSSMHGQYYAADSLENYSEAHFAVKTTGKWKIAGSEKTEYANQWLYFYVTVKGTTADLTVKDENGAVVYQTTDYTFVGKGGVYSDYAINTLLFGFSLEINPIAGDGEFHVYASELRGTLAE